MKYNKFIFFVALIFVLGNCSAQLSDLAKIDYTRLPKGSSDVGYDRLRALVNYPIKLKEETYLLVGLDYSNIELGFGSSITNFDTEAIEDFQLLDLNIGYTTKLDNDWRFGGRFSYGFSSNLVSDLSFDDAVVSADIVFIKDKRKDPNVKKPWRLIVGLSYAENRGIPYPIPFISYYRKFHPKWSYKVGVPKSNLQYHLSPKSRFKLIAELDGFTANIQGGLLVNGTDVADRANMSLIIGGLRYEYKFTDNLELYLNAANILSSRAQLRDDNNNTLTEVNKNNTYYFRTGIRFKI